MMSSGPGRAHSISICHGSTISGPSSETALNFGAAYRRGASEAPFVLSANGRHADDGPKRPMSRTFVGSHQPERFARLMMVGRDTLSKAETVTVAAAEAGVPTLVEAREIVAQFHGDDPAQSHRRVVILDRARGVTNDEAAVLAAIILPWSNGQTEGQITPSNSSDVKCTAAAKSICFRLG